MTKKKHRRSSLPRAAAVRDDILACEAELKQLKRLYKLVLELEAGHAKPANEAPPAASKPFYDGAPVGLPVNTVDDED